MRCSFEESAGGNRVLVSVVTPSFNQAEYLEETIKSVLAQQHRPLEHIVVDGGSSDHSVAIIRRYSERLAWWVSEPDAGQADAINKGLMHASGDVLTYLNSDDYYLPGAITKVVAAFANNPAVGVVYGQAAWVTEFGRRVRGTRTYLRSNNMLDNLFGIPQPAAFFHRHVLERIGLFDASLHFALDADFFLRALGSFEAVVLDDELACMRLHGQSKSVAQGLGFVPEVVRTTEKVIADPAAYPRYKVDPVSLRLTAEIVASRFLYMNGRYRKAIARLWSVARRSRPHRRRIVLREGPRLAARILLGERLYWHVGGALPRRASRSRDGDAPS
jgi:glycosyltransferase involved in cell wall biosynthesis